MYSYATDTICAIATAAGGANVSRTYKKIKPNGRFLAEKG